VSDTGARSGARHRNAQRLLICRRRGVGSGVRVRTTALAARAIDTGLTVTVAHLLDQAERAVFP
jgi:hypothetical protein